MSAIALELPEEIAAVREGIAAFIRAEVVNWQALLDHDGYQGVKEKGLLRLEGKEYIVKDGDVLVIRHS